MLCILRGLVASRPLIGMHQCSPISHFYPPPHYANKCFSQSSKLCARRKHYTPEQLAAFTNYYAILGLSNKATNEDINNAYISLSKRFHPDMMRNIDSQKYWDNPDRPEFVKIKDARDFLLDPAKRKAYDAEYNDVLQALKRLLAATPGRADPKKTIASHLRLDHPTTSEDGQPIRDHCVIQIAMLPPQVTAVDLVRAIAKIRPVGRVVDARLMKPSMVSTDSSAIVEFADDASAQRLGLLAFRGHFHVLGKPIWHCILLPVSEGNLRPPPPGATRVLVVDGPRDHKLMTASAMDDFFGRKIHSFDTKRDGYNVMEGAKGPDSVTIECVFTSWRKCAAVAYGLLREEYPELTVTNGEDPCE